MNTDPGRRTFIVGAGASAAYPAGLPLFGELRSELIDQLKLTEDQRENAQMLAPEVFMSCLHGGGLPLETWLSATLSQGEPNAVHVVLATGLESGDRAWSLNVDELIEVAATGPVPVAAFGDDAPAAGTVLLKPHGTVSRGQFIFRSDQVFRPLPPAWATRLLADCRDRHVVVVGYRGADIDLRPILNAALGEATRVTWFAADREHEELQSRLPALRLSHSALYGGADPIMLSAAFLDWADDEGLTDRVSQALRNGVAREYRRPIAVLRGNTALARALLLERIGDRKEARRAYQKQIATRPPSSRSITAARQLLKNALYNRANVTQHLFKPTGSRAAALLPRRMRERLDRTHVTLLSSHLGNHEAALARAQRALDASVPAIRLSVAKSARFTGDLPKAIDYAGSVYVELAHRGVGGDDLAHALFEKVFAQTWAGDLGPAKETLGQLQSNVDNLTNVRWIAWSTWQHACLAIYDNQPDAAKEDLHLALTLFGSEGGAAGRSAALIVQLTNFRLLNDETLRDEARSELMRLRNRLGWTGYTDTSVDLEEAEWARQRGEFDSAAVLYQQVIEASAKRPVQLALAWLGFAELERAKGYDNAGTADKVRSILRGRRIRYVAAHLAVTDYLAGRIDARNGLARIANAAPTLFRPTGSPTPTPADYCLGHTPEIHQLFMP